jgi:hypothetical protein
MFVFSHSLFLTRREGEVSELVLFFHIPFQFRGLKYVSKGNQNLYIEGGAIDPEPPGRLADGLSRRKILADEAKLFWQNGDDPANIDNKLSFILAAARFASEKFVVILGCDKIAKCRSVRWGVIAAVDQPAQAFPGMFDDSLFAAPVSQKIGNFVFNHPLNESGKSGFVRIVAMKPTQQIKMKFLLDILKIVLANAAFADKLTDFAFDECFRITSFVPAESFP